MMNDSELPTVAIGLGSNLGDRLTHLRFGVARLRRLLEDLRLSSVYETAPVGVEEQPLFLNACCVGRTRLTARQLLSEMQDIERAAGRRSSGERWGPRELDLDLLVYGDRTCEDEHLTVPHPRVRERAFVLVPLAEVAPDLVVPGSPGETAATVTELLSRVDRTGVRPTTMQLGASGVNE